MSDFQPREYHGDWMLGAKELSFDLHFKQVHRWDSWNELNVMVKTFAADIDITGKYFTDEYNICMVLWNINELEGPYEWEEWKL